MKKIIYLLFLTSFIFSCTIKNKRKIHHVCTVTSCEMEPKVSVLQEINRTTYKVRTSCGQRVFSVYREYNIGDTIILTEVILEE